MAGRNMLSISEKGKWDQNLDCVSILRWSLTESK